VSRPKIAAVLALSAALAWVNSLPGRAQIPSIPPTAFYDVRADQSQLKKIGDETVLELTGNVRVVHGDVTITADRGLNFTTQRLTQLFGHVRAVQETMVMTGEEGEYRQLEDLAVVRKKVRILDQGWEVTCDEVRYSRIKDEAWLLGHVVGKDSTSTLRADRVLYRRTIGLAEAFGKVEMTDDSQDLVVHGKHGCTTAIAVKGSSIRAAARPGANDPEPITVVSDTMRVPWTPRTPAPTTARIIIAGNTVTQADSAMLYDDRHRAELYGHPLAKQDNVAMKGDRMVAYYNEQKSIASTFWATRRSRKRWSTPWWSTATAGSRATIMLYIHDSDVDSVRVDREGEKLLPKTPARWKGT
jgi:lipopolysaccharide export system protein LptA